MQGNSWLLVSIGKGILLTMKLGVVRTVKRHSWVFCTSTFMDHFFEGRLMLNLSCWPSILLALLVGRILGKVS